MTMTSPVHFPLGVTLTCAETGKQFIAARDGCSTNYAVDRDTGAPVSDEGVDIRERRELFDRSQPFTCYVSCDGRHVTGWKGNVLGTIERRTRFRGGWHGSYLIAVTVRDVYGARWHGRGAGNGMIITLRPSKTAGA
jgi:hypothetical protein